MMCTGGKCVHRTALAPALSKSAKGQDVWQAQTCLGRIVVVASDNRYL